LYLKNIQNKTAGTVNHTAIDLLTG